MPNNNQPLPDWISSIITSIEDGKGQDIQVLDVKNRCQFTDWMLFVTGTSSQHVKALAERVEDEQKKQGNQAISSEGYNSGEWVLIDFFDAIVHVMQRTTRDLYDLESLWSSTKPQDEEHTNQNDLTDS